MITVKKIAEMAGVTSDTVRHYVKLGLLKPIRSDNNYRVFNLKDGYRVQFIRRAQRLGFTLQEIDEIFAAASSDQTVCPMVRNIIKEHLEKNQKVIDELVQLQARMQAANDLWETMPDKAPDCQTICHLIESNC